MPDEREILLAALKAAGHDQAHALAEVILPSAEAPVSAAAALAPDAVALAASPEIPAVSLVPAPVAELAATLSTPPAGKAPLRNLDEFEALPQAERLARMDEADELFRKGER
jgi:hypothetical protein